MRKLFSLGIAFALFAFAGGAQSAVVDYAGTATFKLGSSNPQKFTGSGVATVNGSSFSSHLTTLRLNGGITGGATIPVTDPEVTGLVPSVIVSGSLGGGTFFPISGGGTLAGRELPIPGVAKICLVVAGCAQNFPIILTKNSGNTGLGVGGLLTGGGKGPIRISLENDPWTLGAGMAQDQTDNGAFVSKAVAGFVHGPNSNTSSTALGSGVIQLIAPIQVVTDGLPGSLEKLSLFGTLRIHFVPEPGVLLLIGSGVVGLALLGRSKMRK